ncbi:MAG: helix-turn-helix transcriptional regulator [Clostridia bacterium]|nr:helix-turn-helix transcriptional regulator [Clostridia bacterium]
MDYISRIKQVKNEKKITNEKLSELTGIPLSTVSKILAGISDSPKLSNMVLIARALGCTLDYIVSGTPENNNNYTLSESEIEFIETYRQLDGYGKDLLAVVAQKELDRVGIISESKSAEAPSESAPIKVRHIQKTAKVLSLPKTTYTDYASDFSKKQVYLYDLPVSAGPGVYLDDSLADEISIPKNEKTESVSYALRISGNSMEPKYRDGDILLVEETETVEIGELGIFVLDGNGYFKKYGGDRLISLNEEYGDILLRDYVESVCCGRVVGKLKRK